MSALDQARPSGYDRAARKAQRHAKSMQSKEDHATTIMLDRRATATAATREGAGGVPAYYHPKDQKYFLKHPREKHVRAPTVDYADITRAPNFERFDGFDRDLTREDVKRWEKRRQTQQQIEYDKWLARRFDITNPHVARWLRKIEPEFWERRGAFLDDKMKIETFLTRIRLYGPQTIEDFEGLYALHKDTALADAMNRPMSNRGKGFKYNYVEGKFATGGNTVVQEVGGRPVVNTSIIPDDSKAVAY